MKNDINNKELEKIELDDEIIEKVAGGTYKIQDKPKDYRKPVEKEDE